MTDEEKRAKKREYFKKYYEANKAKIYKQSREWALKNPEKAKKYKDASRAKNIEKHRMYNRKYKKDNPQKTQLSCIRYSKKHSEKLARIRAQAFFGGKADENLVELLVLSRLIKREIRQRSAV